MRKFKSCLCLLCEMLLAVLLTACHSEDKTILPADMELRPGDVVFRLGNSLESRTVVTADQEGRFSHVGIVVDSAGCLRIVHAVPDEPDFPGDCDRVKMDLPEVFFLQSRAKTGEVMRIKDAQKAQIAAQTALRQYQKGMLFDDEFDDQDSTKMYCTELVLYSYRSAGVDLAAKPRSRYHFPIRFFGYLPSAIQASPLLESVGHF